MREPDSLAAQPDSSTAEVVATAGTAAMAMDAVAAVVVVETAAAEAEAAVVVGVVAAAVVAAEGSDEHADEARDRIGVAAGIGRPGN
ncbi:hypothetical protein [Jongsikchunia kroppenstedtii]|uniref:hypothetical protein n=1 Tax=Jongsikchunia kroppenstedtii TaxID=1121721 RepID=UPI001651AEAB|nr:hypothetical protein [Jongsikchunia kroppenstedtii]